MPARPIQRGAARMERISKERIPLGRYATPEELDEKYAKQADTLLLVHKQRATGKEPAINLWFHPISTQFLSGPDHQPRPMVEYAATAVAAA